jgi:hypothetical protein
MTGIVLRERTLTSASGRVVRLRVIRPDYSLPNQYQLVAAYRLWRAQSQALEMTKPDAAFHAGFAAEVAWIAARELRLFAGEPRHLLVVGVNEAEEVLGLNTAYWVEDEQVWYMAIGSTRPVDQPGYPNPDQVRGIGLEVVGALVEVMNGIVCAPVTLEPLDAAARRFWQARGFHDAAGGEMRMTCPESRALAARLAHSQHDDPSRGDAPFFIDRRAAVLRPYVAAR